MMMLKFENINSSNGIIGSDRYPHEDSLQEHGLHARVVPGVICLLEGALLVLHLHKLVERDAAHAGVQLLLQAEEVQQVGCVCL